MTLKRKNRLFASLSNFKRPKKESIRYHTAFRRPDGNRNIPPTCRQHRRIEFDQDRYLFLIRWYAMLLELYLSTRIDLNRKTQPGLVVAALTTELATAGDFVGIWNLNRFAVKTVNSLFTHFSRFLVFALGGYLAISGRLELGALVAFLSAQEKLYDPWKELIQFYQAYQTASVTYSRTVEYFDVATEHLSESRF
jgi:ABC-type multidrug transport system fused ATPase/permease subunit